MTQLPCFRRICALPLSPTSQVLEQPNGTPPCIAPSGESLQLLNLFIESTMTAGKRSTAAALGSSRRPGRKLLRVRAVEHRGSCHYAFIWLTAWVRAFIAGTLDTNHLGLGMASAEALRAAISMGSLFPFRRTEVSFDLGPHGSCRSGSSPTVGTGALPNA